MNNDTTQTVAAIPSNNWQDRTVSPSELAAFVDGFFRCGVKHSGSNIAAAANDVLATYERNMGGVDFNGSIAIYGVAVEILRYADGLTTRTNCLEMVQRIQGKHAVAVMH
jgi:hypothetical protein